jgi:PAS domain S-box-containing protein
MSHKTWPDGLQADLADLARRREALRQASAMPGADARALLGAAFAELDAAVEVVTKLAEAGHPESAPAAQPDSVSAERALLRAVFQHAPAPLFVLELDGTIRRANAKAGELIGAAPGYATGRALTAFVDLPSRAAVESQLAAAARTGTARHVECRLLGRDGPVDATLTVSVVTVHEGVRLLAVTAAAPATAGSDPASPATPALPADGDPGTGESVIRAMTRRMDMITAVTRLLLDNSTFSEAVTLQRCARLLAGDVASWVIVDIERAGLLRRQFVIGPRDEPSEQLALKVRTVDPPAGSVPEHVHSVGTPVLLAHAEDAGILGKAPDGTPLLILIGATSLLSVPITDGDVSYGALTLARGSGEGRFELADLGLAEELGRHLGVAIRVDRMFRQRSAVAEALQGSLLPTRLPNVPGLELSSAYVPASEGLEVGGDFFDVFPVPDGWAISIGDVCGKGQEAAAMTAAARHAIRALARRNPDPADVLARVNEVMLADDYGERFVTAKLAYLRWDGVRLRVRLASAGHPGPLLVRPDGRVDLLGGGGLPLGLFPDAEPETAEFELSEDDLLFFYTDGVTDARSADLRYFGEGLGDTLAGLAGRPAGHTARLVQDLVCGFCQDELRDDITIVVAKVTSPPGQ